jgi:hypothetical protein
MVMNIFMKTLYAHIHAHVFLKEMHDLNYSCLLCMMLNS